MTKKHNLANELASGIKALKKDKDKSIILPSHSAIKTLRANLNLSQAQFAKTIGISVKTLQNWEQARRSPQGPARALLQIIAKYPEILAKDH
jgi:putative transcriptional regulator